MGHCVRSHHIRCLHTPRLCITVLEGHYLSGADNTGVPSAYMGFSNTGFCRLVEGAPPDIAAVGITHAYIIKFKCRLIQ